MHFTVFMLYFNRKRSNVGAAEVPSSEGRARSRASSPACRGEAGAGHGSFPSRPRASSFDTVFVCGPSGVSLAGEREEPAGCSLAFLGTGHWPPVLLNVPVERVSHRYSAQCQDGKGSSGLLVTSQKYFLSGFCCTGEGRVLSGLHFLEGLDG